MRAKGKAPRVCAVPNTFMLRRELLSMASSRDPEDTVIDFSNASLYLSGLQTMFALSCVAGVSVLSCLIAPSGGVSAVRTVTLCSFAGAALMRSPLRVGKAHGVVVVFTALQPAVVLYILALVVEQLTHTCATHDTPPQSWRRPYFHLMVGVTLVSGLMRARRPLLHTDVQFLMTSCALTLIAMAPPPAVVLLGPLCAPPSGWEAAERVLRAFSFALLYSAHVFSTSKSSEPKRTELLVVVTRAASATIWTLACAAPWLLVAPLQLALVVVSRINASDTPYQPLRMASEGAESETEDPEAPVDPLVEQKRLLREGAEAVATPEMRPFAPLAFRDISASYSSADPPQNAANPDTMSPDRLQKIVNSIEL